ncbi:MAG: envelope stress response membrane protein PspB [Candidatus Hydrogenedentota bacterium]
MSTVVRFAAGAIVCLAILVAVFALLAGLTSVRVGVEPGASLGVSWFVIPVVALPLILLFLFVWSIRVLTRDDRTGPGSPGEEAELMQQLRRTAERLEERVEALETIVLEERDAQRARW